MGLGSLYICLSFGFNLCSLYSAPLPFFLRRKAERGCTLSEWERATAVLGTAVGRTYSLSSHFCNDDFCYDMPRLMNRLRPADSAPDPPDVMCADVLIKKGQSLHPPGSPDGETSLFLPYTPRRPFVNDTGSLRLCLDYSLLPTFPFNHSFIKAPLEAKASAEPDDATVLKQTRESGFMQGTDPMSRQFAEVLINVGVEQVNSQKYKEAIKTFNLIMGKAGLSAGVLIGRATALALAGNLVDAIRDYSRAIELDPRMLDAWRRRAQARVASNDLRGAAADYSQAIEIAKSNEGSVVEILKERAVVYTRLHDSYRAAKDLRAIVKLRPDDAEAMLSLGQALLQLGEAEEAVQVFSGFLAGYAQHKIVWVNLGMAYRDMLEYKKAKEAFDKALALDHHFAEALRLQASLLFKLGDVRGALKAAQKVLQVEAGSVEAHHIKATCHHLLGDFASAMREYDTLLSLSALPTDQFLVFLGFYQREVAAYTALQMQSPSSQFDINANFPARFKEYWATHESPALLVPGYIMKPAYAALQYTGTFPYERGLTQEFLDGRKRLVKAADSLGAWAHALSHGTAPSPRQIRAAGMAALEIMQALHRASSKDWSKTRPRFTEEEEVEESEEGMLRGWRDLFQVAVRWSALADPSGPFFWIDELTEQEFEQGFGITSIILNGHTKNPQYSPQMGRALSALKEEILDTGQVLTGVDHRGHGTEVLDLDPSVGPQVEFAETCKEMWDAVGQDFVVLTPCYSSAKAKHIVNGTNLLISKLEDEGGYHFSLRTISTPGRWREYEQEMHASWRRLLVVLSEGSAQQSKVLTSALRLVYYWYNFMPLAQGSPLAGHVALVGAVMAADWEFTTKAKSGSQFDWEAILTPTFQDFQGLVAPWMQKSLKPLSSKYSDLPSVQLAFPSVSSIIQMLDVYDRRS